MRHFHLTSLVLVALLALAPTLAHAQDGDRIRLAEIVPALSGTELGATDLGPAPAPGTSRVIRRAEIVAVLTASGHSAEGLLLPRQTRIERRAVVLSPADVEERAREAITAAVAPCAIDDITVASSATVGEGELHVTATGPARPHDGAAVVMLDLGTGDLATHLSARVDLTCPEPLVRSGSHVTVVVRAGAVHASTEGIARGEARVGERVHVRVEATGALVEGRVREDGSVEVTP